MQGSACRTANQPASVVQTALLSGELWVRDGNPGFDAPHGQPIRGAVASK
jgi:hypothetical protein